MCVERELLSVTMEQFDRKFPDYNFNTLLWMQMYDASDVFLLSILLFIIYGSWSLIHVIAVS